MGKINNQLLHFPSHLFIEMSFGNSRKWYFRDPKIQKFLREHAPKLSSLEAPLALETFFVYVQLQILTQRL